jgi:hypothetical protein
MFFNFVMDSENPFDLILCRHSQLSVKLSLGHHQVLSQRAIMRYRMQCLSRDERRACIDLHMCLAGTRFSIFTDSGMDAITAIFRIHDTKLYQPYFASRNRRILLVPVSILCWRRSAAWGLS